MKTCSLLWLAIIVLICWVSITPVTGQSHGRSGYQIEGYQGCKKCPAYEVTPSKCTDRKYKYINVPVSAAGIFDICRVCELGMLRFSNKKPPFRCGANDMLDELNFDSGYANNVDAYGRAGFNADRKTGIDTAFYDNSAMRGNANIGGGSDYFGGDGLYANARYGNEEVPMFNQEAQFGRQNPHLARTIVAPDLFYSPVVYEPRAVYVPGTPYRPVAVDGGAGVGGAVGVKGGVGINAGIGVGGSAGIFGHLFGRAGSEDRSSDNIERTYNENKMGGLDDVGSDIESARQGLKQEQDKFEGLRQIYDFGLG